MTAGILFVVATPIGNLSDFTPRAVATLQTADLILCEDTRVTSKLLHHFEIKTPTTSYHQHSSPAVLRKIMEQLQEGKNIALVTDAGTPGISDPGNVLISEVVKRLPETKIIPIPGACAAIAALSISGFPTDSFLFLGFPPHKNKRQQFFKRVAASIDTVVFYESGHRIKKCLAELAAILEPERKIVVCRELTKQFETTYRGTTAEVRQCMQEERGEFVIVVNS